MRPVDLLELGGGRRTPMIHQAEAAECGLACLAMVAAHHGLKVDLGTLRRRFSLSLKGTSLKALMQIADQIGFNSRAVRADLDELQELALPAVLHWDLNHFVVLVKITRGLHSPRYHVRDPERGARVLGAADLSRHFTGVALELIRGERFMPGAQRATLRIGQLWSRMSGLWSALRQVLLLSLVLQLAALATPFYLQIAIDTAFPTFDTDLLAVLALGFGGLAAINLVTSWLRSLILVSLASSLSYQVVVNLYRHLLRLPLPWFDKRHVGDIISRFSSTKPLSDLLAQGLIAAIVDGVMAFTTLALMFVYSPLLAGVALTAWALFALLKIGFLHALRLRSIDAITAAAIENSSFIETIRGIRAIKAFARESGRQRHWQQLKADAVNAEIRLGRMSAGFAAAGQFLLAVERVLFVYLAVTMAMEGAFTVGMVFAFQAYKQHFLDAATRLVDQAVNYRLLDVHLNRIADIALSLPEQEPVCDAGASSSAAPTIEFRNVFFRYGAGESDVLQNVSFRVEAGEMLTIVGPSGGGKTTLLKLAAGLIEPSHGTILIDGRPLKHIGAAWRRRIGSVAQDDSLYAGSLAENIAFFDDPVDGERVVRAAQLAGIDSEIDALPMRYETLVGDMGSALSGGQKQRVLLARALYRAPAVLIIDEGTAHLDPDAEQRVVEKLARMSSTRIVVSHRPACIGAAPRVLAVVGGSVQEICRPSLLKSVDSTILPASGQ
jgi:ATP-binding cassette, subfamily B, bacterial CvaB/MchF/RaxB